MIHIGVQTGYSFLKAYGNPAQVLSRAKETGADTVGIADYASTWGHIPFQKAAKKAGVKLLYGVKMPVVKELAKDTRHDVVTLIAKTSDGLQRQYEAVTLASQQFYYRPRLTWAQVADLAESNVVVANRLTPQSYTDFLGLGVGLLGAAPTPGFMLSRARAATGGVALDMSPLYPTPADRETYQLVNAIGTARKTFDVDAPDQWFMDRQEAGAKFAEVGIDRSLFDRWLAKAEEIAGQCDATIPQARNVRPQINITLEEWCHNGAQERGIDLEAEPWRSRLEMELHLIHEKGFQDYFLLIADLIAWAKERMFVGPARGSSAGSLVCYLMGIVEVDPIKHGLIFERFIDVTRNDLPDVDIDFPDTVRDDIYDYLATKYGADRIARLGTISVFKARSALGDVAKSYSVPKWKVDDLSTVLIERSGGDARANMTIMDTIEQFDKARALVAEYPALRMAERIEGHPRHSGKHAAGVCISDDAIAKYCSIDHHKDAVGCLNKYDAETVGLMKIDALGLRTLSVIEDCCAMAGIDPKHLYTLPLDIPEAFRPFQQDRVAGIFQFEGYAVRSLMRQMNVERFDDIVALTSLARPGPLHCGGANEFIARKVGAKDWDYLHPSLAPHVGHTYGTVVYQEQVMTICRDLGEMDWPAVNALRRAMSKSLGEEFFNRYRDEFLQGTRKRGIEDNTALHIWNEMCTFGSWAFNLSHAVSYALISYWCAYLKVRHPLSFGVAQLRRAASQDHAFRLLREFDKEGYQIVPFDATVSEVSWSAKDGKLVGGFTSVKGVGEKTAAALIEKRNADPEDWLDNLSTAQRSKLLAPNNTPWHNLKRLQTSYPGLYADPEAYKAPAIPEGVRGPIIKIEDIPERSGEYCFIATLKERNLRDLNETQSLAKRNGRVVHYNNLFLNLQMEDDTGSILCTIDRFKYPSIGKPLMEEAADGKDFLIRGRIREDGRRKINVEKMLRLN